MMRPSFWIAIFAAPSAALAWQTEQPAEVSEDSATTQQPMIYGRDGRVERYEEPDETVRATARNSTVALVFRHRLRLGDLDNIEFDTTSLAFAKQLCPGERFGEQPALAACSGALIDDDLVLTAGHCLGRDALEAEQRCHELAVAFDFGYTQPGALSLDQDDIRLCRNVAAHEFVPGSGSAADFAILQLDRPAPRNRVPAMITRRPVAALEPVVLIGNGGGLPTKIDASGWVLEDQTHPEFFRANTDSFVGGSGSPLFDLDLAVLGVQSRGGADFAVAGDCNRLLISSDGSELHQKASRALDALCNAGWPSLRLCQSSPTCGDARCSLTETSKSCAIDCQPPVCGDGFCDSAELGTCASDCAWLVRVPAGWWCPPEFYGDGAACHCECGAVDPDCAQQLDLELSGCSIGRRCGASGRCELSGASALAPTADELLRDPGSTGCSIRNRQRSAGFGALTCMFALLATLQFRFKLSLPRTQARAPTRISR